MGAPWSPFGAASMVLPEFLVVRRGEAEKKILEQLTMLDKARVQARA